MRVRGLHGAPNSHRFLDSAEKKKSELKFGDPPRLQVSGLELEMEEKSGAYDEPVWC